MRFPHRGINCGSRPAGEVLFFACAKKSIATVVREPQSSYARAERAQKKQLERRLITNARLPPRYGTPLPYLPRKGGGEQQLDSGFAGLDGRISREHRDVRERSPE